jgi:esterase/lipase superfamily enzyme
MPRGAGLVVQTMKRVECKSVVGFVAKNFSYRTPEVSAEVISLFSKQDKSTYNWNIIAV